MAPLAALAGRARTPGPPWGRTRGWRVVGIEQDHREHTVSVRLSPTERAAWTAAREGAGRGRMGAWVREVVNAHLAARALRAQAPGGGQGSQQAAALVEELRGVRREVAAIGRNLNQAVARLNTLGVESGTADRLDGIAGQVSAVVTAASRCLVQVERRS